MSPAEFTQVQLQMTPPFIRKIGTLATSMGYGEAVAETLYDAGISVELDGELPTPDEGGVIIASDHRQGFEPF